MSGELGRLYDAIENPRKTRNELPMTVRIQPLLDQARAGVKVSARTVSFSIQVPADMVEMMRTYFGEPSGQRCGLCDACHGLDSELFDPGEDDHRRCEHLLADDDLLSELDAWDRTFDALHEEDSGGAKRGAQGAEGLHAVEQLRKRFPDRPIVADLATRNAMKTLRST